MKNSFTKRILSLLLCAMMLVSLLPVTAFATEPVDGELQDTGLAAAIPEEELMEEAQEESSEDVVAEQEDVPALLTSVQSGGLFAQSQMDIITNKVSTLATGVTQNEYTVYDKNGNQVKMFVATADPKVETVKMFTSYKDMDNTSYGMSKLTEQVAAFDKKAAAGDPYYQGSVVAGINGSYYDMTTGKPSGVFVMNGNDVTGSVRSAYFAVMKDGSVKIGVASDYETDKGNIQEAIGIYKMLVTDGAIALSQADQTNAEKYPRQSIGITADGKVILMSADGNQAPYSIGLTLMEQAQVMLDLGCVYAGHLDGGGSMTYGSKPEGEDSFKIVNKPSDGSERSISNGFIIVSTEAASKEFDHVTFDMETEYVTPGTSFNFAVAGISATGNAAEVPEGVTYKATYGQVESGVYTAPAEVCTDTITAYYNGKEVGTATVNVVIPDALTFSSAEIAVPFGKTVKLMLTATYGYYDVKYKTEDIVFTLENDAVGEINGMEFTANDGNSDVTESAITAQFAGSDVKAVATIKLGKGSETLFDFEDADVSKWSGYDGYNAGIVTTISAATAETGKVHSGTYSMAYKMDFSQLTYYEDYTYSLMCYNWDAIAAHGFTQDKDGIKQRGADEDYVDITGATGLGMWVYIPDEIDVRGLDVRWTIGGKKTATSAYERVNSDMGTLLPYRNATDTANWSQNYTLGSEGWYYYYFDLSQYSSWNTLRLQNSRISNNITKNGKTSELYGDVMQLYINDRAWKDADKQFKSYNSIVTLFIDDITVDYSSVVEDREAPVFGDVTYAATGMSDATVLNNNAKIVYNDVDFAAYVAENTKKTNATGIDPTTAKAYLDGNAVSATYKNGKVTIDAPVTFADGAHTVKFEIADNQGNVSHISRAFTMETGSTANTIKIVPQNTALTSTLVGSLYYIDVKATDIAAVNSVTVTLKVNNVNDWEPAGIVTANGFTAAYAQDPSDAGVLTLTITRTGNNNESGEAVIASVPIRAWYPHNALGKNSNWIITQKKCVYPMDIQLLTKAGSVVFGDGSTGTFSAEKIQIDSEAMCAVGGIGVNKGNESGTITVTSWHEHTAALTDKAATCTEAGYTGRTYCKACSSVVEWGDTVPATGHSYELSDDILKCSTCGDLFTGTWTDGKEYTDGVVAGDGWKGDSYYKDGKKLIGVQKVTEPDGEAEYYYNFGDDGVCSGKMKYTGLLQLDDKWYYSKVGVLTGGWVQIDDNWHFFKWGSKEAPQGEYTVQVNSKERVTYQFSEQGMTKGAWHIASDGGLRYYYGPNCYVARLDGYLTFYEIDGKTYNFDGNGNVTYGAIQVLQDAASLRKLAYTFKEDGSVIGQITASGVITDSRGGMYYIGENGEISCGTPGLIKVDGAIYDVKWSGKLAVNEYRDITAESAHNYLKPGKYYFGHDGKLEVQFTGVKAGEDGLLYYYVDGVIQQGKPGLVEVDGAIYDVKWSGKVATNEYRLITSDKANGLLTEGKYYFGADGKYTPPFTGIRAENGSLYYYVDGAIQQGKPGLVEVDGAIYDVKWSGKVAINEYRDITSDRANGLLADGKYFFGPDGKYVPPFTEVKTGSDGVLYYYVDGAIQQGKPGLVEVDGAIYDVKWSGKVAVNEYRDITSDRANGLLADGKYFFGPDGKLVLPNT